MSRHLLRLGLSLFGLIVATLVMASPTYAYTNSRLMDDGVFDNVGSMTEPQIRTFINSRPTSCLATSGAIFPEPITYWQYGGNVDAARVIYNAARYNDLNPQVILASLQKEQTLITRTNCYEGTGTSVDSRNKALGMGCPDGGACPAPAYAGFHQQVMKGSWTLKFAKERANGNVEWGDNGSIVYGGPWTEGNRKACSSCSSIYRDGYWNLDGQAIKMETGATASLYRYTPHLGQAFPSIFESWFGSTYTAVYSAVYAGQSTYPSGLPGSVLPASFTYRNNGNKPWYDDTNAVGASALPVHLATGHAINRSSAFGSAWGGNRNRPGLTFSAVYEANGTMLASNQHVVQPGQLGKFSFNLTIPAGQAAGTYREYFQPVLEGSGNGAFVDPGTYLEVTVQTPVYSAQFAGQSGYPTVIVGSTTAGYFNFKNAGNMTWYDDTSALGASALPVHLATSNPVNRASSLGVTWGPNRNRPGLNFSAVYEANGTTLASNQHVVQPGQIGRFGFTFTASSPGFYREYMQPVLEGSATGMFADPHTYLEVTVQPKIYAVQFVGQSLYPTMTVGSTAPGFFTYRNTGNQPWYDDVTAAGAGALPVHLATSNPVNRASSLGVTWGPNRNRPGLTFTAVYEADGTTLASNQHVVQPGQIGKFGFTFTASTKGFFREYFRPLLEGTSNGALNDPGTYLEVRVN